MPVLSNVRRGTNQVARLYRGSTVLWNSTLPYAQEVLADSPVAYWRLEETSGSTVTDQTGNEHDGTVFGADLNVSGPTGLGSAAYFDGVDDRIDVTNDAALSGWDDFTVEFWTLDPINLKDTSKYPIANYSPLGSQRSWGVVDNGVLNQMVILLSTNGVSFTAMNDAAIPGSDFSSTLWHHVVFRRSGSTVESFLDGVKGGTSDTFSGTLHASTARLTLGSRSDITSYWKGTLDEPAVYDTALSDARILAHYNSVVSP